MAYLNPAQLMDFDNAERRRHPAIYREVPSSPQLGPGPTDRMFLGELLKASAQSRYLELEQKFAALRDQLSNLRSLETGWDSYSSPVPNAAAMAAADAALYVLRGLNAQPTAILPSADGGVGICFIQSEQYAHIEFENSGDAWALMYGPNNPPETWQLVSDDVGSIRDAWSRISARFQS